MFEKLSRILESSANKENQLDWIAEFLANEYKIICLIQYEEARRILDNHDRQYYNENTVEELKDDIEVLQRKYWYSIRDRYQHLLNKPRGSYIRAFDLHLRGHLPYTQDKIQAACKALGGCCAYNCGCCYKARNTDRMKDFSIHCSALCSCCVVRHKRVVPLEEMEDDPDLFAIYIITYNHLRVNLQKIL